MEFLLVVVFQGFHVVEHTLEVLEKRLGQEQLHPLLGGTNFEWTHFIANTLLFVCSIAVLVGYGRTGRAQWRAAHPLPWRVLVTGIAVQAAHVIEHTVRIVQYINGSREPAGLATVWLDPVWFHWSMNMVFFACLLVGFFGLRAHRDLFHRPLKQRRPSLPSPASRGGKESGSRRG